MPPPSYSPGYTAGSGWTPLAPAPARDEGLWTAVLLVVFGIAAWGTDFPWLFACAPLLVFVNYLARARLVYLAGPDRFVVQTLIGRRSLPYTAVQKAEYLELSGGLRLVATFMPGYVVGWVYLSGLGRQLLLGSTDRGPAIRLHTERGTMIITPHDPVAALAVLDEHGIPLDAPRWVLKEVRRYRRR
ncbi:PH domain-containing protein [Thermaerobacter composti]|uniref:PH domain-containing protein n=1 Tax=Thermaerobacter composti TaxID=554949 RepID=A0ABZ0QUQ4_9FIRM|nr:PH domain-containing protein [Thermaerobacter composti]WPD20298.1 PH domain-containing protein [Thermaerobacter composti]